MMDSQAVDTQAFLDAFMTLMQECAIPLFEEAKTYAQGAGLNVRLELHGAEKANPGLCLLVAYPDGLPDHGFNSCCITAEPSQQKILHEDFYSDSNQRRVQRGKLASINQMVLHTRLATFFQTAFGLQPDYIAKQHPAGFW
ncbi:MAG: hypothetical protein AAAB16_16490 [Pseudomonas sp.]|uniref:hypothetical protein n=1 Tax=Pseudomonas sp. TaxID=306 RepID=UPI0030EFA6C3